MSKKLLYNLNGEKTGAFRKWLDNFKGEPRIAWYPSAMEDFRDLLYLNRKYSEINPPSNPEPPPPDIFLHTDYNWQFSNLTVGHQIYFDKRTSVFIRSN